jgi:hypothetical protein
MTPVSPHGSFFATALLLLVSSARAQSDALPAAPPAPASTPAPVSAPPTPVPAPLPTPTAPPEPYPSPAAAPETVPVPSTEPPSRERPFTIDLDTLVYNVSAAPYSSPVLGSNLPAVAITPSESYLSMVLGTRYVRPSFRIDIELPFGKLSEASSTFGNIAFGVYYRQALGTLELEVGGILALPTAPADSTVYLGGSPGVSALVTPGTTELLASRGGDRAWLWIPHYVVPLAPSARLASPDEGAFSHATELTLAPMIATDAGVNNVLVPVIQLAEEVATHASVFRAGARAEVVGAFSKETSVGYFSVMPFVGIGGKYGFLDVGALFDLANPPGPSEGNGPNWGLRVRGGLHF